MNYITKVAALLLALFCTGIAGADGNATETASISHQYTITDLGSLGGLLTEPFGINDGGQIVGYSQSPDGSVCAFLWQSGKMTELSTLKGDQSSTAYGINNKGQAVGVSYRDGGATHAVMWNHGSAVDLGLLGNDDLHTGLVKAINDNGQMVVNCVTIPNHSPFAMFDIGHQQSRVLLCTSAGIKSGRLLGRNIVGAIAINNSGAVVGQQIDPAGPCHCPQGFLWKEGVTTHLGAFQPSGINANEEVVGTITEGKLSTPTAALWKNGTVTPLRFVGSVRTLGTAINDKGEVVGATDRVVPQSALLWNSSHCVVLNNCLLPKGEWMLINPTAINDLGQIVGYGKHSGKPAAFLMTPIPATEARQ